MVCKELGQLVSSKAGRDSGKSYLIVGFEGDGVLVADGRGRSIENPKKKNRQHLIYHKALHETIRDKLSRQKTVTDAELNKALLSLIGNRE